MKRSTAVIDVRTTQSYSPAGTAAAAACSAAPPSAGST